MAAPNPMRPEPMTQHHPTQATTCQVCGETKARHHSVAAALVQPNVEALIKKRKPDWSADGFICGVCLNRFRTEYVREEMEHERGELSAIEHEVLETLHKNETVVEDLNREFDQSLSFGDRLADRVAKVGGSWGFVMAFGTVLIIWVIINVVVLATGAFDPYPFILLNLFLSMLAAIQAPIIMMSQNRSSARDRQQAENDFKTNLKAELEVRAIGDKLDQLLHNHWARLMEIQEMQMQMMQDMSGKRG
jgi:uncharacterized membrane protein